jgi:FkbM family methyltransferase
MIKVKTSSLKSLLLKFLKLVGYEVVNLNIIRQSQDNLLLFRLERYLFIISKRIIQHAESEQVLFQELIYRLSKRRPSLLQQLYALYCSGTERKGFYIQFHDSKGQYFSNDVSPEKELQFKNLFSNPQQFWKLQPGGKAATKFFSLPLLLLPGESSSFEVSNRFHELDFIKQSLSYLKYSTAQIFQDLLAVYCSQYEQGRFFVEFVATNGHSLSNTWMLEKTFHWKGIICEPGRTWHEELRKNRNCIIDERCVWTATGELLRFNEAAVAELSTIQSFSHTDHHSHERVNGYVYEVPTISLNDLLKEYEAPQPIDFMSVDTEGSELDILKAFDFHKYPVQVLTVEHNYTPAREAIYQLLQGHGFVRVFTSLSRFDDWYVHESLYKRLC